VRVSSVEVIPYALPFRRPYVTAAGRLERRQMVLLRLRSDEGAVGLGEAVPMSLRGGATLAQVVRELQALASSGFLQSPLERGLVLDGALDGLPEISAPARCAALTALMDLSEGVEPPETTEPEPVPCNATLTLAAPEAVAEDARRWLAEGFTTFKLKLGAGDDLGQVAAVRQAIGAEARIRIDANGAWGLEQARRMLAALEPFDIELVEQPVATMEEASELSGSTTIPLAGDESIVTVGDAARAKQTGAFALTGIKLSKVGGILPAMAIAATLPAYVSSALDGPVGIAAGARLAQALRARRPDAGEPPTPAHGLATQRLFASTVASVECELHRGMLHLPPGPGLGVQIDEEALEAHRI
jgi:o-succinylbenzoate synthase